MNVCTWSSCGMCGRCEDGLAENDGSAGVIEVDKDKYPNTCDWCQRLIWPGDELLANHGGRFCGDECATLWAEGEQDARTD